MAPDTAPVAQVASADAPQTILRANLPRLGAYVAELGGLVAAVMRGGDKSDYLLIVPDKALSENPSIAFSTKRKHVDGAGENTDGQQNTAALCAAGNHPAAQWCSDLVIGQFNDFYLPARHELRACYLNAPELFSTDDWYWTSTQHAGTQTYAWVQYFGNGGQIVDRKGDSYRARAVRRLAIQ